ncbi:hypothetical protein [Frondihabitans peucedani]|uniref:Uncharacterized protein n=1 Tax=Frondihabitans peucedani TaxID=598626 RepID=A0ABP8E334_9MICO
MSDDDIIRDGERRIAAMTSEERNELLHRRDGYYAFDRHRDLPRGRRYFYKIVGADQFELVDGAWKLLGQMVTCKHEPRWWLMTGEESFPPC